MTWLVLALTAIGGMLVGWFAHALLRERLRRRGTAPELPANLGSVSAVAPIPAHRAEPAVVPPVAGARVVSADADTAGRVLLHLASLGRLSNDEVGRVGYTQRGMVEALGIRQGTLAKVLSRLNAAKVLEVDRRHVAGQPQRLNVYRLTALGESVAREIRHGKFRKAPPSETRGP